MYRSNTSMRYAPLRFRYGLVFLLAAVLVSCGGAPGASARPGDRTQAATPTIAPIMAQSFPKAEATTVASPAAADVVIQVDGSQSVHPISPLIYGLNDAPEDVRRQLIPTLNRWGGNPSTRYNWRLGNAWNAGSDWFYRNGDYGYTGRSASDDFVRNTLAGKGHVLLTLPTLGWVAKNNDNNTCSFPASDGHCGDAEKANCERPGQIADPRRANVESDVTSIVDWVKHLLVEQKYTVRFFAMDNEPDLWGFTHYDVHPNCSTYDEIRDKYLEYATAVREVAPQAELLGPVSCCWNFYWNSAAGADDKAQHDNQDFLPWFLQQVRQHDQRLGKRTLDVLDIHYYPEGLYNDQDDTRTAAHRLRSTRSLWEKTYVDESWIGQPVYLIPRMKQLIDANYPGTKLGISEWNWGADKTMNGALALADVLGIMGREDVYLASYWRYPEIGSPGFFAFKMFRNYDDRGGHFGDTSIQALSSAPDQISAYAAINTIDSGVAVLLLNKDPQHDAAVAIDLRNISLGGKTTLYRYSMATSDAITSASVAPADRLSLTLPAYSISLLVFEAQKS